MANEYLDKTGLSQVWAKSTNKFASKDVASKTASGLCPQLPNETTTTKFLRQDGTWAEPTGIYELGTYTYAYTISANGAMNISASDLGMSTPPGYTAVAARQVSSGNGNVIARTWNVAATGSTAAVSLRNVASAEQSATCTLVVLYVKDTPGNLSFQSIYSGTDSPSSSQGVNGDIYIKTS